MTNIFLMLIAAPFGLSLLLCGVMVWLGPRDHPDGERKMQARPVATSGGLAVFLTVAMAFLALLVFLEHPTGQGLSGSIQDMIEGLQRWQFLSYLPLIAGAALIGWADDLWTLSGPLKMTALALLALFAAGAGYHPHLPYEWFIWMGRDLAMPVNQIFSIAGTALFLFTLMNAVNFMDGLNGLAMGTLAIQFSFLGALFFLFGGLMWREPSEAAAVAVIPHLLLVGALLGFLIWNMAGRLYAGDIGALGLGAFAGTASLFFLKFTSEYVSHSLTVFFAAILFMPFFGDVLLTMAWRARRGERLMRPHRDHAYQLFHRSGWRHWQVSALWWVFAIGSAGLAVWSFEQPLMAFCVSVLITTTLWVWQRRTLGRRLEAAGM